jgi:hypothetical protein
VGKPEGKTRLGESRCGWIFTIQMDFKGIEWRGMDLSGLG